MGGHLSQGLRPRAVGSGGDHQKHVVADNPAVKRDGHAQGSGDPRVFHFVPIKKHEHDESQSGGLEQADRTAQSKLFRAVIEQRVNFVDDIEFQAEKGYDSIR